MSIKAIERLSPTLQWFAAISAAILKIRQSIGLFTPILMNTQTI
ncbi:hypothetical protein PS673_02049 [Pseudomonas fluorescens]|uniref:Uncharacterized protein n=1 Tax=Pseudomonas fluorescens TaxID=294 RepID=A0A5E6S792_PSEFL|nr:hypothetical protein PS673_02049 [Pseudomonas fluorescens]